jgi:hypothetical protein
VTVVLSVLVLIGLVCFLLWLIGLGGDEDEETAGFVTANWDRIRDRFGG